MARLRDKAKRQEIREQLYASLASDGVEPAAAIKDLRRVLAMDQAEFAKHVGVSLSTLRKIEQKSGNATLASIEKILAPFSLSLVVKSGRRTEPRRKKLG